MSGTGKIGEQLEDAANWFVRNPETGEVVAAETPNRRIKVVYVLRASRWLLHRLGLTKGAPADLVLSRVADLLFLVWALDEAFRGRSPYRRAIGVGAALYAVRSLRRGV